MQFTKCFQGRCLLFHLIMFQSYLRNSKCWVKCLGRKKMWKLAIHPWLDALNLETQYSYNWLIFFPILSGCFVISLSLTIKKEKKNHLKHIFNIFYLAGFPDISSVFYLLALEVNPGYCIVLFHSVPLFFFFVYSYLPFEKFICLSFKIHTNINEHMHTHQPKEIREIRFRLEGPVLEVFLIVRIIWRRWYLKL